VWCLDSQFAAKTSLLDKFYYPNKPSPLKIVNSYGLVYNFVFLLLIQNFQTKESIYSARLFESFKGEVDWVESFVCRQSDERIVLRRNRCEYSRFQGEVYNVFCKMPEKIKTHFLQFVKSLSDVRVLGQVGFAIIVLMVSWSGVKAIQTNYELQKKIARLEQEVAIADLEKQNLALENEYLKTDQFLELAAREQFGKARLGEKVYIIPKDVALKYTVKSPDTKEKQKQQTAKPAYQQNLEDWVNFFFRRSDNKLING